MTNSEPSRLDKIEASIESNARAIQAMLDAQIEDRQKHEDFRSFVHETISRLTVVQEGVNRLLAALDEERPTILKKVDVDRKQN